MATQNQLLAEIVAGMKKACARKPHDADSDDEVQGTTNRGAKLKRLALDVRHGQVFVPSGPLLNTENITHAGYERKILYRNPIPVDGEGFGIESDDDEAYKQEVLAAAADSNPYAGIRLEQVLGPLTSPATLLSHPSLSQPFTMKAITQLANQARDNLIKEYNTLWKAKNLLSELCGDSTWAPVGVMEGHNDHEFFQSPLHYTEGDLKNRDQRPSNSNTLTGDTNRIPTVTEGVDIPDSGPEAVVRSDKDPHENKDPALPSADQTGSLNQASPRNVCDASKSVGAPVVDTPPVVSQERVEQHEASGIVREAASKNGVGKEQSEDFKGKTKSDLSGQSEHVEVHPFFLPPESYVPARDVGLPVEEAQEFRKALHLYVQRQEEICRGCQRIYQRLLKADRLRKDVTFWSKVEAHRGLGRELSDGEDWYDKEEWGLEDDLKKGHGEEEEETQTNHKKIRTRRQ